MSSTLISLASGLFIVLLGMFFLYSAWYSAREWAIYFLLNLYGQHAQAKIVRYRSEDNRAVRYFVTYRFHKQSSKRNKVYFEREQQVSGRHIKHIRTDDSVEVVYLPQKPTISMLTGAHLDNTARDGPTIIALIAVLLPPYPVNILIWGTLFFVEFFTNRPNLKKKGRKRG